MDRTVSLRLITAVVVCVFSAGACIHKKVDEQAATDPQRSIASGYYADNSNADNMPARWREVLENEAKVLGGTVKFPGGLTTEEAIELWHLSEGSDVFPAKWFVHMKSAFGGVPGTRLNEKLDEKFGVVRESAKIADSHRFPFKWIGLSASWSEEHPTRSDVYLDRGHPIEEILEPRKIEGKTSIAMVGVNCAFCHTNEMHIGNKRKLVEGGPNMMYIRGYFQDLFGSAAKTMLDEPALVEFLRDSKAEGDINAIAKEFSTSMKKELGLELTKPKAIFAKIFETVAPEKFAAKKSVELKSTFFQKRDVVAKYMTRLLEISYNLRPEDVSHELKMRMKWLAEGLGVDPNLEATPEGYGRTDAFGRIANWVARRKEPIALNATVSVPSMWNIQYRSTFHFNANTNSVVMRNLGQSFGLGAIRLHPEAEDEKKFDATSNLHNLVKLEKLLYKIEAPNYQKYFSEIDLSKAITGCNLYYESCAKCHSPDKARVGPKQELIAYRVLDLGTIGTDAMHTRNMSKPVDGVPFRRALFDFTKGIRNRYYQRFGVPPTDQRDWQRADLRGEELFRDTSLGESSARGSEAYMNIAKNPTPGYIALPLASAWATAPYLHNGSVPTLYDLLSPAKSRPHIFFVGTRQYDTMKLGYKSDLESLPLTEESKAQIHALATKIMKDAIPKINLQEARLRAACQIFPTRCFDTSHNGNGNGGHEMYRKEPFNEDEKQAIIEFMKILRPEPEYSRKDHPVYSYNGVSCSLVE